MLSETKSRLNGKTFLQTLFLFLLVTQICFAQSESMDSDIYQVITEGKVITDMYNSGKKNRPYLCLL